MGTKWDVLEVSVQHKCCKSLPLGPSLSRSWCTDISNSSDGTSSFDSYTKTWKRMCVVPCETRVDRRLLLAATNEFIQSHVVICMGMLPSAVLKGWHGSNDSALLTCFASEFSKCIDKILLCARITGMLKQKEDGISRETSNFKSQVIEWSVRLMWLPL